MNSAIRDQDETAFKPHLVSYAEIDTDLVARADRAKAEGARYVPPPKASNEDIEAALRAQGLLDGDKAQIAKHFPDPEGHYRFDPVTGFDQEHRWLVATFAPRLHDKVQRGCDEHGWIFTCPKAKEWRPVPRPQPGKPKKVAVERPLFGTYGFLRPAEISKPDFMALERVDGLGALVRRRMTREPVTVPMGEVEKFMRLEAEGLFDATRSRPPKVRRLDKVLITSGPFQGVQGLVEMTVGERVKVLLGMLGIADVPMEAVELVS